MPLRGAKGPTSQRRQPKPGSNASRTGDAVDHAAAAGSTAASAKAEKTLQKLRIAWVQAHEGGAPCFTDPLLIATVAESLDCLESGLREAADRAGVAPVALLPQGKACALALALCFPPEGGLALDPDAALELDFFEPGGAVRSVLPDFLCEPSSTGRTKSPLNQLHVVFLPQANSWLQLSTQTACFLEQIAWLMLDPSVGVEAIAGAAQESVTAAAEAAAAVAAAEAAADAAAEEVIAEEALAEKPCTRQGPSRKQKQQIKAQHGQQVVLPQPSETVTRAQTEGIEPESTLDVEDEHQLLEAKAQDTAGLLRFPAPSIAHEPCKTQLGMEEPADDTTLGSMTHKEDAEGEQFEMPAETDWTTYTKRKRKGNIEQPAKSWVSDSHRAEKAEKIEKTDSRAEKPERADSERKVAEPKLARTAKQTNCSQAGTKHSLDDMGDVREMRCSEDVHKNSTLEEVQMECNSPVFFARSPLLQPTFAQLAEMPGWSDPPGLERSSFSSVASDNACPYNFCEVNTASWSGTEGPPWIATERAALAWAATGEVDVENSIHMRECNGASWSSRGSMADADPLNLCEINTASWNSASSRNPWQTPWNSRSGDTRGTVRGVQDVMADLALLKGLNYQAGESSPSSNGAMDSSSALPHGSLLTAEALAALSRVQEVSPPGLHYQALNAGGSGGCSSFSTGVIPHWVDHSHGRHDYHHDHHLYQNHQHHQLHQHHPHLQYHQSQHRACSKESAVPNVPSCGQGLPPVPEDSKSASHATPAKLSVLEQHVESEEHSRERRSNNMRWRIWAVSGNNLRQQLSCPIGAAVAGGGEIDSLWLRESRWERRRANAAKQFAHSRRNLPSAQRAFKFWQQNRHRSFSPSRTWWLGDGTSSSPLPEGIGQDGDSGAGPTTAATMFGSAAASTAATTARCEQHPFILPHMELQVSPLASHTNLVPMMPIPYTGFGWQGQEDTVFVAVPRSRVEAVAQLLANAP